MTTPAGTEAGKGTGTGTGTGTTTTMRARTIKTTNPTRRRNPRRRRIEQRWEQAPSHTILPSYNPLTDTLASSTLTLTFYDDDSPDETDTIDDDRSLGNDNIQFKRRRVVSITQTVGNTPLWLRQACCVVGVAFLVLGVSSYDHRRGGGVFSSKAGGQIVAGAALIALSLVTRKDNQF